MTIGIERYMAFSALDVYFADGIAGNGRKAVPQLLELIGRSFYGLDFSMNLFQFQFRFHDRSFRPALLINNDFFEKIRHSLPINHKKESSQNQAAGDQFKNRKAFV